LYLRHKIIRFARLEFQKTRPAAIQEGFRIRGTDFDLIGQGAFQIDKLPVLFKGMNTNSGKRNFM